MGETEIIAAIVVVALLIMGAVAAVILPRRAARLRMMAAFREVAEKYEGQLVEPTMRQPEDFQARHMQLGDVVMDMAVERELRDSPTGRGKLPGKLRLEVVAESAAPDHVAIDLIPGGDPRAHRLLILTGHALLDERCLVKSKDPEFATAWLGPTVCDVLALAPGLKFELKDGQVRAKFSQPNLPATAEELDALIRAVAAFAMGEEHAAVAFPREEHRGGYRRAAR